MRALNAIPGVPGRRERFRKRILKHAVVLLMFVTFSPANSYELHPKPSDTEVRRAKSYDISFRSHFPVFDLGVHLYSSPVHEQLSAHAHGCDFNLCSRSDVSAAILAGVVWNDDPPFSFDESKNSYIYRNDHKACRRKKDREGNFVPVGTISFSLAPDCWIAHFKHVQKVAKKSPLAYSGGKGSLLARSHFGDLQFLHSMATRKDEAAEETRGKILMWAELMWRIDGRSPDDWKVSRADRLSAVKIVGINDHFRLGESRTIEELFALGRPWFRNNMDIEDMAFGSLLHMVQDSFSGSHAIREGESTDDSDMNCRTNPIREFQTYAGQKSHTHSLYDQREQARTSLEKIHMATQKLINLRSERASWEQVEIFLKKCVFPLSNQVQPAGKTDLAPLRTAHEQHLY
ncbi:hypothetical protein [Methyloversatilis discipulorum]|uniref:hypothetical protein n=1 Tax=Methyloversatilis discipulorum TaxID=1119528 RepID=UPI0012F74CF9|nr:hypothetical protein [Methyloversatilis discipulorum]